MSVSSEQIHEVLSRGFSGQVERLIRYRVGPGPSRDGDKHDFLAVLVLVERRRVRIRVESLMSGDFLFETGTQHETVESAFEQVRQFLEGKGYRHFLRAEE